MKSILFSLILLVTASAANAQDATLWSVDKSHSSINFKIRHFFTPVAGSYGDWDGVLRFDPANLKGSSINMTINAGSVNTANERRDGHLRTADFFETDKFPAMRFVSNDIQKTGENSYVAVGTLTIKETSKQIRLPFTFLGSMPHPRGGTVAGFKANYQILRNDYGVGTGSYVETSTIGNEVDIEILLEVVNR
jgi:polyisoprenoid-binding protein YceI